MWITLIKLSYTPLRGCSSAPDIHQGEKLYGRLLPSVLRVSEKNSSKKLADQARSHTPRYRICMPVYGYGSPRMSLLGSLVNRGILPPNARPPVKKVLCSLPTAQYAAIHRKTLGFRDCGVPEARFPRRTFSIRGASPTRRQNC